ncbi:5'-hydroxyaverantin dehydrogenase [Pseudocercospora fuligena]|uniref:5'-hydroxyaverantin dehydrogenase n=1 Tax=Pseudocercospora fuligena TaxID=685502 RepID=A0A8H6R5U5_9PEZI|nr:5'-hydroxyaverantin dehydrogenase [Pseudocercospora fuligena]
MNHQYEDVSPKVDCSVPFDNPNLTGKTAVVTGGGGGIGEQYTRAIVSCGGKVVIADINEANASSLQAELGGPENVVFVKCDVREWKDQVDAFRAALKLGNGKIDIVINNAGVGPPDDIFAGPEDDSLDEPLEPAMNLMRINALGALMTAKLATFYFRKQAAQDERDGAKSDYNLIIQASLYGYLPSLNIPQYAFSKWGQRSLLWGYRHSERKYGVRTNMICPWYIPSGIVIPEFVEHLNNVGAGVASAPDAAGALLRILGDSNMNGRSIAIVPRSWDRAPNRYLDIDVDQYKEGSFLSRYVDLSMFGV